MHIIYTAFFCLITLDFYSCCCPYFDSATFKAKRDMLNNRSSCPANYSDLDPYGHAIPYTGSDWCQIFAARAFCHRRCGPSKSNYYTSKLICESLTCGGNGMDPKAIGLHCICDVFMIYMNATIRHVIKNNYTWSMVEDEYDQICVNQNASDNYPLYEPYTDYPLR